MPEHLIPTQALIGAWVAVGLTLFIFSFLYKDNPLFKLGEHLYVGISVGYSVVVVWFTVFIRLVWQEIAKGNYEPLIPVMIGLLIWTRFVPKIAWLSRLAFAFVVGFGSGVAIPRTISSYILKQIEDTVNPLVTMTAGGRCRIRRPRDPGNRQREHERDETEQVEHAVALSAGGALATAPAAALNCAGPVPRLIASQSESCGMTHRPGLRRGRHIRVPVAPCRRVDRMTRRRSVSDGRRRS